MKIAAIIADDQRPQGWPEHYTAPKWDITQEEAEKLVAGFVARYNSELRGLEIPRRMLSVTLLQISTDEAWGMGGTAYHDGDPISENYWPQNHPNHSHWRDGWDSAEYDDTDEPEEDEEE